MGINIKDLIIKKEIDLDYLNGKTLAVDSFNMLYQFLTTIRQRDGTPLMDSQGRVTSHLSGLFSRSAKFMEKGIKLAFVFDGEPPHLKKAERERRRGLKEEAQAKYKIAVEKKDVEEMKKYASRTAMLSAEMVNEAKELISALGMPVIQAPSEGEAQAAHLVKRGDAFASVSQDFDSLLYCCPKLVRNLSVAGKRKRAGASSYDTIKPEIIDLSENLNNLGIDKEQLIALAMLIGTDYNIGGIKGIGPKTGLKLVKQHGSDFDSLFHEVKWDNYFECPWSEVFYLFKKMPVTDDFSLDWRMPDEAKIKEILVEQHNFSEERVNSSLSKLSKRKEAKKQKGLGEWM
jgi:flap endonuclease-1